MSLEDRLEEARLWIEEGFPVKSVTKAVEVPRSVYYYHQYVPIEEKPVKRGRPTPGYSVNKSGVKIPDEQIEEFLMEAVEGEEGIYGYRKLTEYLRDTHDLIISPKKVYRLCDGLDILLPKRTASQVYPRRMAKQHVITRPNQLWQVDIKYGTIGDSGRFFFLASAIDVFDRCIVGYYRGAKCQAVDITKMIQEALMRRLVLVPRETEKFSIIVRSDNGPQFVSRTFGEFCSFQKIYHERIPPKSPNLNAYIESFHSIIERECYQRYTFDCFDEAYYRIDEYMEFYNERRYHGSLNYLTPMKFHQLYKNTGYPEDMAVCL
ncbi:IS3 family transposase [uncultured Metabacillus sp.]|uniref:IS3 family transposase n=1 Tax=uncultured Metabacillus sp. TaxID=2860135 RepID=UPI002613E490|nr:IS3 family transposase [uncultured Metabacillus sp.]